MERSNSNYLQWKRIPGLSLILWLALTLPQAHAQDIDVSSCGTNTDVIFSPVVEGTTFNQTIGVTGTGGNPASMALRRVLIGNSITSCNSPLPPAPVCSVPFTLPLVGITDISISGDQTTIEITPEALVVGDTIKILLEASITGTTCTREYFIPIIRKPVDLMLVLDNSPSMNCCTNIDDPTCVSCADPSLMRMTKLKQAVDLFFTIGNTGGYFMPDDRFGAVIFSGTIDDSQSTYVADPTPLNTYIQAIGTSGGTCIGGSLIEAIDRMTTQSMPNRTKSLLLFTDGEQNYNPMLNEATSPVQYHPGDLPVSPYNPSAPNPPYGTCITFPVSPPTFNAAFRDSSPGITVSTIGFKLPPGPSNIMLVNLANSVSGAGGTTNLGTADPFDFTDFFNNAFVDILSGNSPQIVKKITGTTIGGTNTVQFVTNDTLSKVTFIMMGGERDGNSLRFKVMKNGKDVTSAGRIVDKGSYRLWHINFPIRRPTGASLNLTPGGTWTLQTSDTNPGISYMATCIVDDHKFRYDCEFGDPGKHAPGKAIPLSVSLTYNRNPVDSAQRVLVAIERNTGDGGTLLATLAVPEKLKSSLSANAVDGQDSNPVFNNVGQLKHYALLEADQSYAQALAHVVDTVVLTNNNDGTYTGEYVPSVTGPHKFTYLIKGTQSNIGAYQRVKVQSSVVKITKFDLSAGNVTVESILDDGQFSGYRLSITLKDSTNRYLGPAFGSAIDLKSAAGTFGKVTDNLDGSYTIVLSGLSGDTDPVVSISVYGVTLFEDNISNLDGGHKCPSWIPDWLAKLFHAIGLNCVLGLIILVVVIILLIIWLIRRKK